MSVKEKDTPVSNNEPDEAAHVTPEQPPQAVVLTSEPSVDNEVRPAVRPDAEPPGRGQVHVPPNLQEIITGAPVTTEEIESVKRRHLLNKVIHKLLSLGLIISTVLMLAGIVQTLVSGRPISQHAPQFREALGEARSLRPSGLLSLGLLTLIATPIFRVLGSLVAFVYEKDWCYAGLTLTVVLILFLSLMLGKG